MSIQVVCSSCKASYSVPDARAGQTGRCKCGQLMLVPGPEAQAEPPPSPTPGAAPTEVPLPPVIEEAEAPQQGQVRCPHCGMGSRPGPTCEWCNRDMPGAAEPAEPAGPPSAVPPHAPVGPATHRVAIYRVDLLACLRTAAVLVVAYVLGGQVLAYALRALGGARGFTGFQLTGAVAGSLRAVLFALIVSLIGVLVTVGVFNFVARLTNGFRIRLRDPVSWDAETRELARVSPRWALAVGALTGLLGGGVVAVAVAVAMGGIAAVLRGSIPSPDLSQLGMLLLRLPPAYAVTGGIGMALSSLIYNVIAPMWGGIGFEAVPLEEPPAVQRRPAHNGENGAVRVQGIDVLRSGLVGAAVTPIVVFISWLVMLVLLAPLMLVMGGHLPSPSVKAIATMLVGNVVVGFIGGAIGACIYNLVGWLTGGLEIEARG